MLIDLLRKRYSCRNFSEKTISKEIIEYILESGRLSASGGNEQPWKFGVITNKYLIDKISEAASIKYSQKWISKAPLVIVLCTQLFNNLNIFPRFPSKVDQIKLIDNELYNIINMEEHQTKIPGEHMVLAALEHGIYSTWISHLDCEMVGKLIGLNGYIVSNVIVFGYPANIKDLKIKKALNDIIFTNHFDNKGILL